MTSGRLRAVAAAALVLAVVTLAGAAMVDRARRSPRTLVTVVRSNAHPGTVVAPDCPSRRTRPCTFAVADTRAVVTVLTYFRSATVLDSYDYTPPAAATGADGVRPPALEVVRVRTSAGVVVSVTGRCIAGAGSTLDRSLTSFRLGPLVAAAVDGRAEGCSVAVVLNVPKNVVAPFALATALAHDERIAVAP